MVDLKFKSYYDYDVYEDGTVYSHIRNKVLSKKPNSYGYILYTLHIDGEIKRILAHRLVAMLYLGLPSNYSELVINHKEGNKVNNHYSNLEWCTQDYNNYHARVTGLNDISKSNSERWKDKDFSERTRKHFSEICLKTGANKGKKNPRFRYLIYDKYGNEYDRHSLASLLGISQSHCDTLIRKGANAERISCDKYIEYGIKIIDIKKNQSTIENANKSNE